MKEIQDIAKELSKGNVKKASEIREALSPLSDKSLELELTEIAKQAMISHLKKGKVEAVKEIKRLFPMPQDLVDETIQQAVMSSFCDGDVRRIQEMKDELPISRDLGVKIVAYCASWGKKDSLNVMQSVFA